MTSEALALALALGPYRRASQRGDQRAESRERAERTATFLKVKWQVNYGAAKASSMKVMMMMMMMR